MASRSSSRSEGEVLSSDSEAKAKQSLSSRNNSRVDRHTRPYPALRSPIAGSRRSRSRSPYRAPRGEKRRREDDFGGRDRPRPPQDPRTFSVRYEDERYRHRRGGSHDDRHSKRSRTQSRSPYRHSRPGDEGSGDRRADDDRHIKRSADSTRLPGSLDRNDSSDISSADAKVVRFDAPPSVSGSAGRTPASDDVPAEPTDQPVLDEAALIEERRRRREAIKNKYRSQATPLLVQALHLGAESRNASPAPESSGATPRRSESPMGSSPQTPKEGSGPQSPADVSFAKDEDLANDGRGFPVEDGPSAADYDVRADMEEERSRHDKRLFKEDEQSLDQADQHVPHQEPEQAEAPKTKAEFDMFAEDDEEGGEDKKKEEEEDDMFAAVSDEKEASVSRKTESQAGQALDVNMMDNWDDPDGYYITILGELIENRYHVTQNLGRGMFSSVVRATDTKTNTVVAIKIVRNNETMRKAGIKEMDILKNLAANDPDDKKHMIRLLRSFDHKGHLCMVFENLSLNLREVLKKFGRDVGINLKAIRAYAQQLFLGLSLLKKCQYLHADLKPDNILVNEARNVLKICDLGSASPITENAPAPYLVSRFYRAPEVILGIPYDYGIDMWSIGCTLFELYTGKILFTGRNNNNMLRAIMECRGKFPHKLLRRGALTYEYFDDLLNFRAIEMDKLTGRMVTKLIDIKAKPIRDLRSRLVPKDRRMDEHERREVDLFLDLLDKCLALDPAKRITPSEALKHPFVTRARA